MISEWLDGSAPSQATITKAIDSGRPNKAHNPLRSFKRRFGLATLLILALLGLGIYFGISHEPDQPSLPNKITPPGEITATDPSPQQTIPITNRVQPNPLPQITKPEHYQRYYWGLVVGLPLLLLMLYLLWRYLPQMILRKQSQDDEASITGLNISDLHQHPGAPFSSAKTAGDLNPLLRPYWIQSKQVHVADSVLATANNFGFFTPVYRQRIQYPDYIILVQSRHGQDQMTELAELFIQNLQRQRIQLRAYRFRDDPRRLYPISSAQPQDAADSQPLSLADLALQHDQSRLIMISDWDIAFSPFDPEQVQPWFESLQTWAKRLWLSPGYDSPQWAELAKEQANKLGIRLLPLSSHNAQDIARWLSHEHNPLASLSSTDGLPLPAAFSATVESWLSWRPPHAVKLTQLMQQLRDFLGVDGFLLLQALAVFPKPLWPLPYVLDLQLSSAQPASTWRFWLPTSAQAQPSADAMQREQRLINIGRLPWSRHAYMPDYMRECLLKALTRAERKRIRETWRVLLKQFTVSNSAEKVTLPIASAGLSKIELQQLLAEQVEGNALDDAIFANILLGGKLGLLDFKLPRALAGLLPSSSKLLDLRPALAALVCAGLMGWSLAYGWQHGGQSMLSDWQQSAIGQQNSQWQVKLAFQEDTKALASALQQSLQNDKFNSSLEAAAAPTSPKQNTISYAPGGADAARRIQQRLSWLNYGVEAALVASDTLPPLKSMETERKRSDAF